MKNYPSVLTAVVLIASVLLQGGYSYEYEGYEPENVIYAPIEDVRPGYVSDWNSRRTWSVVGRKWHETDGWGPDYRRWGDDWYARRGDWDLKGSWHKPGYKVPVVIEERKDVILDGHRRPVVVEERNVVLDGHRGPVVLEKRKDVFVGDGYRRRGVFVDNRGYKGPGLWDGRKDFILKEGWSNSGYGVPVVIEGKTDFVVDEGWQSYKGSDLQEGKWSNPGYEVWE